LPATRANEKLCSLVRPLNSSGEIRQHAELIANHRQQFGRMA
jgi:hypothetical protein